MLNIKRLSSEVKNAEGLTYVGEVKASLKCRASELNNLHQALKINNLRRTLIQDLESLRHLQKEANKQIAEKNKNKQSCEELLQKMKTVSGKVKSLEKSLFETEKKLEDHLLLIPNILHKSTPMGSGEKDNVLVSTWGEPRTFSFTPQFHHDLGVNLDILDFDRAAKVSGSRFSFLKGAAARLERALINFMVDYHREKFDYCEITPPFLVNRKTLTGCGQLPKFEEDVFHIEKSDLFLIPTSEVPVTLYYADEILNEDLLPFRFVATSPCFRSEAGSYGKDVKGLMRQHQFTKVELVHLVQPENSYEELERMLLAARSILEALELPYRVMSLCAADVGFSAAKTYDIEVWLPSAREYREISSCSNCEDFQSRRSGIRFRKPGGKPEFVHTLNGSGLAVGRTLLAVLENYQTEDGQVKIPKALQPYFGGQSLLK